MSTDPEQFTRCVICDRAEHRMLMADNGEVFCEECIKSDAHDVYFPDCTNDEPYHDMIGHTYWLLVRNRVRAPAPLDPEYVAFLAAVDAKGSR